MPAHPTSTATDSHDLEKRQDAAQVAIEGFWARPTSSGDGVVDLENYIPGLADRIGWTGSTDELHSLMDKAVFDQSMDGPGRNVAKNWLHTRLKGKVNDKPVGDDPYLQHRRLSNEDAVARMRDNAHTATDTSASDGAREQARLENKELSDMLLARVPADGTYTSDAQQFRSRIAVANTLVTANPRLAREAAEEASRWTPPTPDHVKAPTASRTANVGSTYGDMSPGDRDAYAVALNPYVRRAAELPRYSTDSADQKPYEDLADEILQPGSGVGYTGSRADLVDALVGASGQVRQTDDPDAGASAAAESLVDRFAGARALPRTENADGTPLGPRTTPIRCT